MTRKSTNLSGPPQAVKGRRNLKKRSLNAFAIASAENPDILKVRQHRLGEAEGGQRPRKRARVFNKNANGDDSQQRKSRDNAVAKGRFDELDMDEGSDSEGN